MNLARCCWPAERLPEALELLARAGKLPVPGVELPAPPPIPSGSAGFLLLERWVESSAECLQLEAEAIEVPYADLEGLIRQAGPALLRVGGGEAPTFLLLVRGRRRHAVLLDLDGRPCRVPVLEIAARLREPVEGPLRPGIDRVLTEAGIPEERRARARGALLRERVAMVRFHGCWILRLTPGAGLVRQLVHTGLHRKLLTFFVAHALQYLLMILAWSVIGRAALEGRIEREWLVAWALLLVTQIAPAQLEAWTQGLFAIGAGALIKLRLLYGALRLDPEAIRSEGAGQLLARVVESSAIESMALNAGFSGVMTLLELCFAAAVIGLGEGGGLRLLLFLSWIVVTLLLAWRYFRRRLGWTRVRVDLTNDLVERMVGHRTRLAQERPSEWHEGEDLHLAHYLERSAELDRAQLALSALLSRGWLLLGLIGLFPVMVKGGGEPTAIAVALGGIMLASKALGSLSSSLGALTGVAVAWQQVAPLFHAAAQRAEEAAPEGAIAASGLSPTPCPGERLLEAHGLTFRYPRRGAAVLAGCDLEVRAGARLLLEGPSGGGKSTLAALLSSLARPESGLVLLRGLDLRTLGTAEWRRRVVCAPQFHQNHVMTGTLAYNLLLGRGWPASSEDLEEAEQLCRELGLGPLLERMPSGIQQVVGETGWRLSHGERSRIFLARALLQQADVVILDESFAALDPGSLRQALQCTLRRAPALLVIAHP